MPTSRKMHLHLSTTHLLVALFNAVQQQDEMVTQLDTIWRRVNESRHVKWLDTIRRRVWMRADM